MADEKVYKVYEFYVNEKTDEHGRNTSTVDGYKPLDPVKLVYTGRIEQTNQTDEYICELIYHKFNHPSDLKGHSMSVGDVLRLGDTFYAVTPNGWAVVETPVGVAEICAVAK